MQQSYASKTMKSATDQKRELFAYAHNKYSEKIFSRKSVRVLFIALFLFFLFLALSALNSIMDIFRGIN